MKLPSAVVILLAVICPSLAEQVAPGVTHTQYDLEGPRQVFVIAVERSRLEYKLDIGWPQRKRNFGSRQTVSTIAGLYDDPPARDVIVAVNASFFGTPPDIVGAAASRGEMLEHPNNTAFEAFFFGSARQPAIGENLNHVEGTLTFADGTTTPLHDYNRNRTAERIVAYTPQWAATTGTSEEGTEILLDNVSYPMRSDKEVSGTVTAVKTGADSLNNAIPAGGMILAARGEIETTLAAKIQVGHRLRMKFDSSAGTYNNADMAVAGNGWLVKDGAAYTDNWARHSQSFVTTQHPRTVIGWNNTHLFLIVIDGRSALSVGMNFEQLAEFLITTLACTDAINLDGGGSSAIWVNGVVKNRPSDGQERAVANAVLLVKDARPAAFPFTDAFTTTGRQPGWDDKFTYNDVMAFTPAAPGGDGYVVQVHDPAGGVETMRRGDIADTDYAVQADIYCDYRPDVAGNGYERCGIFARDDGVGGFGLAGSSYGSGNCYALVFDSDAGRVRPGKFVNGVLADFRESSPLIMASTAWRRFRIECAADRIRYLVDGAEIAAVTDTTFAHGYFGIGYHERFTTNTNIRGTRADNFSVTAIAAPPGKAAALNPADGATGVADDVQLEWAPGAAAASHRVQFGTTCPGVYRGAQETATFNPGLLQAGRTYCWRVDEVNGGGTSEGDAWRFTTGTPPATGDFDGDHDVDMDDFGHFQTCLTGISVPQYTVICLDARMDGDLDVDQADLDLFLECLAGANLAPPSNCIASVPPIDPIPSRPTGAVTGSAFVSEIANLPLADRETRIREEITRGNIPGFLHAFVAVEVTASIGGTPHAAVFHVMPDYLSIGSDADFVRMPMTPMTAQAVCDAFECTLPTRKMANDIYTAAAVKLAPSPISPATTDITLVTTFYQHHQTIEGQRVGHPLGLLVGGIKKDVVITPQLVARPGKVAIYGWHQLNGQPIQPLYLGHIDSYVDYSHGLRMVKGYMLVDGVEMSVADVLRHPQYHVLLSDEGVIDEPRYPL